MNWSKRMRKQVNGGWRGALLLATLILTVFSGAAGAEAMVVPNLVNYQGMIQLVDGTTDVTGIYDIDFYLYDLIAGGELLWAERQAGVHVVNGGFNVILGAGAPIPDIDPFHDSLADVFLADNVYVQIKVGLDDVSEVRQRFLATPHALRAQNAATAVHGVPAGTVMPFAGINVPYGWLLCDGTAYSSTQYDALYGNIAQIWGDGTNDANGTTDFNVPNFCGRILIGVNGSGHPLGKRVGDEKHDLTAAETPMHAHPFEDMSYSSSEKHFNSSDDAVPEETKTITPRETSNKGYGSPHNTIQPSAVIKYIIKW